MVLSQKAQLDSEAPVRCYCPVCNKYLGTRLPDEVKVFKTDGDCQYDWVFYPGSKKPKGIKHEHKKDAKCDCGRCGR